MAELNRRQTCVNSIRDVERFINGNEFQNASRTRLGLRRQALKRSFDNFMNFHEQLVAVDGILPAEFDAHEDLRREISELVVELEAQLLERADEINQANNDGNNANANVNANAAPANGNMLDMRYLLTQKIENTWGEFDGTLHKWQAFRDMFTAAVHEPGYISNSYKFQLLIKSLKGEAEEILGDWKVNDENYLLAWERLTDYYNQPHRSATVLIDQLKALPTITKANRKNLQKISNVAHNVVRQLTAAGQITQESDVIFLAILEDKLDSDTKRFWELERTVENPSMREFLRFVEKQARSWPVETKEENKERENRKRSYSEKERSHHNNKRFKSDNRDTQRKDGVNPICVMNDCTQRHALYRCSKFLALNRDKREEIVKKNRLCLNCLHSGHSYRNCERGGCFRCNEKHSSSLCKAASFAPKALHAKAYRKKTNPVANVNKKENE